MAQISPSPSETTFLHHSEYPDLNVTFTPGEIQEIRKSWNSMKDDPSAHEKATVHGTASAFFCQQFYENLLGEYPELKVLFPSIKGQASSMAGILSLVISQLDNLQRVNDILTSLGKRHSRIIGVEVAHYELVGNALLRTLQDRCSDGFTIELENAWIKLYSYISNLMLQAGEDPPMPQQALYPLLTPTSSITSASSRGQQPVVDIIKGGRQGEHANGVANGNMAATAAANSSAAKQNAPLPSPKDPALGPRQVAAQPSQSSNVGYDPSRSYFKRSDRKKNKSKKQDCIVM